MNNSRFLPPAAFLLGLAVSSSALLAQNFIFNGGFETPTATVDPAPPLYTTTIPGWELTGLEARFGTGISSSVQPTEGNQFAAFNPPGQPFELHTGTPDADEYITQFVTLLAGNYRLSFDLNSDSPSHTTVGYLVESVDAGTHDPLGQTFLNGSAQAFISGNPLNPITAWTFDAGGNFNLSQDSTVAVRFYPSGSHLDGIELTATPVPEGESFAIVAGLALGGFALVRRVRR